MKKVIIIGAGPAGLTAGYDLLSKSSDYDVTIIEESPVVGGLCARLENDENVLDAGGHLYISNNPAVKKFWSSVLPAQGVPSKDDLQLDRYCKINNDGPDPEVSDDVLLSREKITRVYKDGKFFESPIKFNKDAVKNFGIANSIKTGFSQIGGNVFKHKELSLEDYYVNRFGKQLYSMFLEEYLEKIWGKEPSKIKAEWGEIAEKSLIAPVISTEKNIRDYEKLPAPYANRYYYPKYGSFQMWETAADRFIEMGGSIHKNCKVTGFTYGADKIISVRCCADGDEFIVPCDYLISSMPIRDLILGMDDVDGSIRLAAENLTYRGLISVCVELSDMKWKNDNKEYKSIDDIVPDSVIYISDPNLKVSRIQVYNNFSPYMIRDSKHFYLGLNYYCNEGDYYWSMGNRDWRKTVVNDLLKLGIIDSEESIIGYNKTKYSKAFPMYYDGYENLEKIINFLNGFENLYCVGRNGQHRFSSVDEAMKTSFEAVNNIIGNVKTKDNVWKVNEKTTEDDKVYNSALLSGEGEYRGNYIPLQKKLDLDNNDEDKEYVPPRRMRRPMMTPIKKADPNKLSEPIIINDSVVIAARPEKSIPISDEDVTDEALLNEQSAVESVTESVQFDDFDTKEEYEVKEVANEYEGNVENTESLNDADLFAMANESIELEENAQIDAIEEDIIPEAVSDTVETAEDTTEQKIELTNDYLDEILGLDFDEGKKKKTSKARGKKAAVKEKNSIDDSLEEKNEDALTESFAKEAAKILEEFAVEENTEIIETEEPIVEAVSETLEEAVIEAVPEFVEEAAIEEVPETADEAVIETVPETVEEVTSEDVFET
ncbi:MAG: FAD-dependent oxidoreductase, partial [Lachnospiraceae bacterium]|nr:FAD-dependent oxidoreductase [Lachnospiraceae bacterium]